MIEQSQASAREADLAMMRLALRLAELGAGTCAPNPAVGALVAREEQILARGWHRRAGGLHAEIIALHDVDARGATLYVTLEPCSSWGRTAPCTEEIVRSGIRRVVYASSDRDPRNAKRARAWLVPHGIEVVGGLLEEEADRMNERFFAQWR